MIEIWHHASSTAGGSHAGQVFRHHFNPDYNPYTGTSRNRKIHNSKTNSGIGGLEPIAVALALDAKLAEFPMHYATCGILDPLLELLGVALACWRASSYRWGAARRSYVRQGCHSNFLQHPPSFQYSHPLQHQSPPTILSRFNTIQSHPIQ